MIARWCAVGGLLVVGVANAADWRASLPDGWIAAVEATELGALEQGAAKLLAPWGRKPPLVGKTLAALLPDVRLAERPWGLALVIDRNGGLSPAAFLPTDDYEALCDALGADRAEGIAVANVSGYDLALIDREGWVQVSLIDALPEDVEAEAAAAPAAWAVEGDVRAIVSPTGLKRLAEGLRRRRQGQLEAGRGHIGPWRWPKGFDEYFDRLAPYAPMASEAASWDGPLEAALRLDGEDLHITAHAPLTIEPQEAETATSYTIPQGVIGHAVFPHGLPPKLADLAIAWMKCRPDEIDAPEYPQPQWDDAAAAYRELLTRYRSAATYLTLPGEDEPVATNQIAAFTWDGDSVSLGDAMQLVVLRWNQLIDAAEARTPLRLELAPLEDAEGWRLSTDLFEGFGIERSPEVEEVFDRYYGGDVLTINLVRRPDDGVWLVTYGDPTTDVLPPRPREEAADGDKTRPVLVEWELRVDRWFAWKSLVEKLEMAGALGYRPREPMAESPAVTLRVTGGDATRLEMTMPVATYDAAVEHWRSNKKRPPAANAE